MFLVHRPSPEEIVTFIEVSRHLPLSYGQATMIDQRAAGFRTDQLSTVVGQGLAAFERAKNALAVWRHFDVGWVELFPRGAPIQRGTVVAVLIRHLGCWSLNGCRIVQVIETESEFGFAYGTLTNHAEQGEELFKVSVCAETGQVSYLIRVASKPRALLARLGTPAVRVLQARFRRDSAAALGRAIGNSVPTS
jgi:uncharacterized protein (UPF0548 family)